MTSQVSCRTMGLVAAGYFELILPATSSPNLPLSPDRGEPVSASPSSSTGNKVTLAGMRFRDKLSKFIRPTLSMSLPPYRRVAAHHALPFYERFKFFEFSGKCYVKLIGRYGWHVKHAARESHAARRTKWPRTDSSSFAFSFYQHLSLLQRIQLYIIRTRMIVPSLYFPSLEIEYFICRDAIDTSIRLCVQVH